MSEPRMDPYSTHLPMLLKCVALTQGLGGPVLELGCGNYSTNLLHEVCRKRLLVTYERDFHWMERFADLATPTHQFFWVRQWDEAEVEERRWDVALVDHGDADRRRTDIRRLADKALFVVVHDTEDPAYRYDWVAGDFKYAYTHDALRPWTTVFSNYIPLDDFGPGPKRYVKP